MGYRNILQYLLEERSMELEVPGALGQNAPVAESCQRCDFCRMLVGLESHIVITVCDVLLKQI